MYQLLRVAAVVLLIAASGCTSSAKSDSRNWFPDSSVLRVARDAHTVDESSVSANRNSATLRIKRYSDLRIQDNPRLIGVSNQLIRGVSGSQLLIDQDLADLVTDRLKQQFELSGFVVIGENDPAAARFVVAGVIKDLTLDVKYRDEIAIAIDTTVTDTQTGQVAWSGLVTEKDDRFAGVSGNTKQDVADYLVARLAIALKKIVLSAGNSLMASHPELFSQVPGGAAIPGVVNHTGTGGTAVVPSQVDAPPLVGNIGAAEKTSAEVGSLQVSTSPSRAKIYIDDVYFGLTPLRLEMPPGIYSVAIKLDGYRTLSEKVSVRKDDNTEMELTLQR